MYARLIMRTGFDPKYNNVLNIYVVNDRNETLKIVLRTLTVHSRSKHESPQNLDS